MIIACPACETRFRTDPTRIGPQGTKVRCAKCGHVWTQMPEAGAQALPVAPPPAPKVAPPPEDVRPARMPDPPLEVRAEVIPPREVPREPAAALPEPAPTPRAAERMPAVKVEAAEPVRAETPRILRPVRPAEIDAKSEPAAKPERRGLRRIWPWALLITVAGAALFMGFTQRKAIVCTVPRAFALYELFGLEAKGTPLQIRNVTYNRYYSEGVRFLEVRGEIVNPSDLKIAVPRLKASLADATGKVVYPWNFVANAEALGPREVTAFSSLLSNPAAGATSLAITFAGCKTH